MQELIEKLKNIEMTNLKKPFSLLEMAYKWVRDKELVQSEMLAKLLSPDENHGHGSELVEDFLHYIGVDFKLQKVSKLNVETERKVTTGKIDIFISWYDGDKNHAVIIENKLNNAKNQPDQLNKYYRAIFGEDYVVDKIVYMPLFKELQKLEYTDTKGKALEKTIVRDAQDIVIWLEKLLKEYPKLVNGVANQYKDFLNCLISNEYIMMNVIKIQDELKPEDFEKLERLAKIIHSKEWSEGRVKSITDELKKDFPNIIIKGNSKIMDDSECNNYVQLWFEECEFWVELWIYPKNIRLYLCSYKNEKEVMIDGFSFVQEYPVRYYYYYNEKIFEFDITETNRIVRVLKPILQELPEREH